MIRFAEEKDAPRISALLRQVLEVHAAIRPDMYRSGTQKYSEKEVVALLKNPDCRIFAETDEADVLRGYCICFAQEVKDDGVIMGRRELYIDDLCVDETARRKGVAKRLFEHVRRYAKEQGFDWITLNVWNGNAGALAFSREMGMTPRRTILERRVD